MPGIQRLIEKAVILRERDRIGREALGDLVGAGAVRAAGSPAAAGPQREEPRPAGEAVEAGPVAGGGWIAFDFSGLALEDFDTRWLASGPGSGGCEP